MRPSSSPEANTLASTSTIEERHLLAGVLPLRIKILGLDAGEGRDPATATILIAKPIDPTNRLPHFLRFLREYLATTGFMACP